MFSNYSFAQIQLSWKDLEDVEFSDLYVQELDEYVLYPSYGMDIMALNGQEVILTGYVLEIDHRKCKQVEKILSINNIYYENIGITQEKHFEIEGEMKTNINDLYKINHKWYNNY